MGFLGKMRKVPLFRRKRKQLSTMRTQSTDLTEEDESTISSAEAFDRLFAERNAKGLLPLRQVAEEESSMMDSDDTFLLSQTQTPKKSRFSSFDHKTHDAEEDDDDYSPEYEPPQLESSWYDSKGVEEGKTTSSRLTAETGVIDTSIAEEALAMDCEFMDCGQSMSPTNRIATHSQLQRRTPSGNLRHIFIDDLPTLYEDEGVQSDTEDHKDSTEIARRGDESDIRARWDYALDCMTRMGQYAEGTFSLNVFSAPSSASFAKPPLSPSMPMRLRKSEMEVAEI
jgi:hypothetical protein